MKLFTSGNPRKLAFSAMIIAMYAAVMYLTQSFAFGAVQVRIATALYALAYNYPFLVIPMGVANFLSNMLGGMGLVDMAGGAFAGMVTCAAVAMVRRHSLPRWLVIPAIILGPGLIVPIWLSGITGLPYPALAASLCAGQAIPAVVGWMLCGALEKYTSGGVNHE